MLVFRHLRLVYTNQAAQSLASRLRTKHRTELSVLIRDHLRELGERLDRGTTVTLLTAQRGEPFHVHVTAIDPRRAEIAVSIHELGAAMTAFSQRYRLSPRETQVVELVLLGYRNREIASALGASAATIKKHLTHVFDKVGVDTRTQLVSRIA